MNARFRKGCALAMLLAWAESVPAHGAEVWTSTDGASLLETRAFYKTMLSGFRMEPGLVEGTTALGKLLGTPELALPDSGGSSAHTTRTWGRFLYGEHLEFQAGWQIAANFTSDPSFAPGSTLIGDHASGREGASRRLVDFEPVLADRERFLMQHNLDLLALKIGGERGDLIVGRQVFSWGSGRLWNPTDLLSPFAPTDIDREVRRGIDAVRASVPLGATAQADILWLPQQLARDNGGLARARFNVAGFDISPSVAKYVRDMVYGLDAGGDIGPVGLHAEAALTDALDVDERFVRAVAGVSLQPTSELFITGEYYFNGWGTTEPENYLTILQSPRVARGEVFGAGRHYFGLVAAWQATGLLSIQGIAITNLTDPSMQFVPALEYWAAQSVLVRFGGYIPLGRKPDPAGLKALTIEDVLGQSDVFRREVRSMGLRSEYGASPLGVFTQLSVYFL